MYVATVAARLLRSTIIVPCIGRAHATGIGMSMGTYQRVWASTISRRHFMSSSFFLSPLSSSNSAVAPSGSTSASSSISAPSSSPSVHILSSSSSQMSNGMIAGSGLQENPDGTSVTAASSSSNTASTPSSANPTSSSSNNPSNTTTKNPPINFPSLKAPYFVDTLYVTQVLERQFPSAQSETLQRVMVVLMQDKAKELQQNLLEKNKFDVLQYSNRADSQNLRNELRSFEKTEYLSVKTQLQALEREIDQINQRFRDDIGNLKTNMMIELNDNKTKSKEWRKKIDLKISETDYKLTLSASDVRTEIETVKLRIINSVVFFGLIFFVLCGFLIMNRRNKSQALPPPPPLPPQNENFGVLENASQ